MAAAALMPREDPPRPIVGGSDRVVDRARGALRLKVTLQYFDGCPSWETTADHLRSLIAEHDIPAVVRHQLIETAESAVEHGFRGSPTVLVDGIDPFSDPDAPVGLSCRIYMTPDGLAGSPTKDQLLSALRGADS